MESLFYDELSLFETVETRLHNRLTDALVEYNLQLAENHYVMETVKATFWDKLKAFYADLIATIKTFHRNISIKIETSIAEVQLESKLRAMKKELEDNKYQGAKTVKTIDMVKYKNLYLKMNKDLWKEAKRFEKINYSTVAQIDHDLEVFQKKVDDYDKQLDEVSNTKIEVDINEAIKFIQNEIDGTSAVVMTIYEATDELKEMKANAELLQKKRDILGRAVLPDQMGFFQKIVRSIFSFIKKHTIHFITTIIFIFA